MDIEQDSRPRYSDPEIRAIAKEVVGVLPVIILEGYRQKEYELGISATLQAEATRDSTIISFNEETDRLQNEHNSRTANTFSEMLADVRGIITSELEHPDDIREAEDALREKEKMADDLVRRLAIPVSDMVTRLQLSFGEIAGSHKLRVDESLTAFSDAADKLSQSLVLDTDSRFGAYVEFIDTKRVLENILELTEAELKNLSASTLVKLFNRFRDSSASNQNKSDVGKNELVGRIMQIKRRRQASESRRQNTGSESKQDQGSSSENHQNTSHDEINETRIRRTMQRAVIEFRAGGRTDLEIYRILMKNFHPDTSEHSRANEITQFLARVYDGKNKSLQL